MKKFLLSVLVGASAFAASAYTASDFVGKVCGQIWLGNEMNTTAGLRNCYGVFEADPSNANNVILKGFNQFDKAVFTVSGSSLKLVNAEGGFNVVDPTDNSTYEVFTVASQGKWFQVNYYQSRYYYNWYGPTGASWTGTIQELPAYDCLKVSFSSAALAFIKDVTFQEMFDISKKAFFYVYDANGIQQMQTSNGAKENPIRVSLRSSSEEGMQLGIHNFAEKGWSFRHPDDELVVEMINGGVVANVDADGNVTIDDQPITGVSKTTGYETYSGGGYWVSPYITYTGNDRIRKTDNGGAITGKYVSNGLTVSGENLWHKDHAGDLEVYEDANITLDSWVLYRDLETSSRNMLTVNANSMDFMLPDTPSATMKVDKFGFNDEDGLYVKGELINVANDRMVESYEIYAVPGKYTKITDNGFDCHPEHGHSNAISLTGYDYTLNPANAAAKIVSKDNRTFEKLLPPSVMLANGWDLNNKEYTFYVRFNFKSSAVSRAAGAVGFGAMGSSGDGTVTSVGEILGGSDVDIRVAGGEIVVSGAENVEVYTVSGTQVYAGGEGSVAVQPGMYVVKAGQTVKKVVVK